MTKVINPRRPLSSKAPSLLNQRSMGLEERNLNWTLPFQSIQRLFRIIFLFCSGFGLVLSRFVRLTWIGWVEFYFGYDFILAGSACSIPRELGFAGGEEKSVTMYYVWCMFNCLPHLKTMTWKYPFSRIQLIGAASTEVIQPCIHNLLSFALGTLIWILVGRNLMGGFSGFLKKVTKWSWETSGSNMFWVPGLRSGD